MTKEIILSSLLSHSDDRSVEFLMKKAPWKTAFLGLLAVTLASHVPTFMHMSANPDWVQAVFEGINCFIGAATIGLVVMGVRYQRREIEMQDIQIKAQEAEMAAQKEELEKQRLERLAEQIRQRRKAWPVLTMEVSSHLFLEESGKPFVVPQRTFKLSNLGPMIMDVELVYNHEEKGDASSVRVPFDLGTAGTQEITVMEMPFDDDGFYPVVVTFTTSEGDEGSVKFLFEGHRLEWRKNLFPWSAP